MAADIADFEQVYREHFSAVYKYVVSLCGDAIIAEEVTQEAFFKALENYNKFKGNCKLYVWLCQIAKNTYFSLYRKRARCISESGLGLFENAVWDIETEYCDKETTKRIHILLHKMDEPYKEVFSLRLLGEFSFAQIGDLFGKTDSWARLIFYRAKRRIQEGLK